MRYVLEAIGDGHKIGFDSLVRAVYVLPTTYMAAIDTSVYT